MNEKHVNSAIGIINSIAAILVVVGVIFKLQHHPNGLLILLTGFILGAVTGYYDTFRLKKKIKRLEEELNQKK